MIHLQHYCINQRYKKMKKLTVLASDFLGVTSAILCLVHCLALPILSMFPMMVHHNPYFDLLFACIGLCAAIPVLRACKTFVAAILTLSFIVLFLSILLEIIFNINTFLIYFGGIGIIAAHLLNIKHQKY
jgi:hypothetical protein